MKPDESPSLYHSLYPAALKRADAILSLPAKLMEAKLHERNAWDGKKIPSREELALLIIEWAEQTPGRIAFLKKSFE